MQRERVRMSSRDIATVRDARAHISSLSLGPLNMLSRCSCSPGCVCLLLHCAWRLLVKCGVWLAACALRQVQIWMLKCSNLKYNLLRVCYLRLRVQRFALKDGLALWWALGGLYRGPHCAKFYFNYG